MLKKQQKRYRCHKRVRAKIRGTSQVPRLCVFRSGKHIYAQLIDDEGGKTLLSANDLKLKVKSKKPAGSSVARRASQNAKLLAGKEITRAGKVGFSYQVGKLIAQMALDKKFEKVIFDRGGYKYHGRIKAVAEGARERGLKF